MTHRDWDDGFGRRGDGGTECKEKPWWSESVMSDLVKNV